MINCPKCINKSNWVSYAWCGKYRCTRCEWVFGRTPDTTVSVVEDQYAWWL